MRERARERERERDRARERKRKGERASESGKLRSQGSSVLPMIHEAKIDIVTDSLLQQWKNTDLGLRYYSK